MSEKVQELLTERGNSFGLILDDISIVSINDLHNRSGRMIFP